MDKILREVAKKGSLIANERRDIDRDQVMSNLEFVSRITANDREREMYERKVRRMLDIWKGDLGGDEVTDGETVGSMPDEDEVRDSGEKEKGKQRDEGESGIQECRREQHAEGAKSSSRAIADFEGGNIGDEDTAPNSVAPSRPAPEAVAQEKKHFGFCVQCPSCGVMCRDALSWARSHCPRSRRCHDQVSQIPKSVEVFKKDGVYVCFEEAQGCPYRCKLMSELQTHYRLSHLRISPICRACGLAYGAGGRHDCPVRLNVPCLLGASASSSSSSAVSLAGSKRGREDGHNDDAGQGNEGHDSCGDNDVDE